jgi:3D (Asp-Asp-Asp) domain-containing protein
MQADWGTAVVVDPRLIETLRTDNARLLETLRTDGARLRTTRRLFGAVAGALLVASAVTSGIAHWQSRRAGALASEASASRHREVVAQTALESLASSHASILAATAQAPSVGTKSWGRRFSVTKYVPRSPAYGKDNDGLTSTMVEADPAARIVAVDPQLIPYKSWVWIEDLGWYRADDCGGAIKGFRLAVLTATESDAFAWGRKDRFVIVVPPTV